MSVRRIGAGRRSLREGRWGGGFAAEVAADHPLFFLRLDETSGTTMVDAMAAHNGTMTGSGFVLDQPGAVANVDPGARSIKFTGSTYIDMASAAWMNVTSAASWSFWLMPNANMNNAGIFSRFGNSGGGGNDWLIWYNTSNTLEFLIRVGGVSKSLPINAPQFKTWSQVFCTYDGANQRVYTNGIEVASLATTGNIDTNAGNLNIGGYSGTIRCLTNHFLDEVCMYDYAVTPDRVLAQFNAGLGVR
jgi:hypothetical protein